MKTELKFFWIPVVDHAEATKALNACLVSNTVLDIEKSLVERPQPGWSVCVTVAQQALESGSRATSKKSRVDYREVLDEETFRIFSGLRETRKALAAQDGVPLYTIANNEQLADIAGRRLTDPTDFSSVAGFGGVKQTKYAIPLAESCKALVGGAAPVSVVAANGVRTP